jgi:cytochrome c
MPSSWEQPPIDQQQAADINLYFQEESKKERSGSRKGQKKNRKKNEAHVEDGTKERASVVLPREVYVTMMSFIRQRPGLLSSVEFKANED